MWKQVGVCCVCFLWLYLFLLLFWRWAYIGLVPLLTILWWWINHTSSSWSTRVIYFAHWPVDGIGRSRTAWHHLDCASSFTICLIKLSTCSVWGTWCTCLYLVSDLCTNSCLFKEGCICFCLCLQIVGLVSQARPFAWYVISTAAEMERVWLARLSFR